MQPLVYVVIVNWNGKHFLKDCLDSISKQSYQNLKTIVVDNGSTDGSADFVKRNYRNVILIQLPKNLGFAEANNVGFRHAMEQKATKYIAILNNDTKVHKNWISEMVKIAENDFKIGTCACKILNWDRPDTIDTVGIDIFNNCTTSGRGQKEPQESYSHIEEIFGAAGAAALYRRKMLEDIKIGKDYFDSDYFIYQEEFDLSWRAFIKSWKCVYVPTSIVYHKGSGTMRKISNKTKYLLERNRIWTLVKNLHKELIFYSLPHIIVYEILSIPFYILSRRLFIVLKARAYALLHISYMIKKRHDIQKNIITPHILVSMMKKKKYLKDLKMNLGA